MRRSDSQLTLVSRYGPRYIPIKRSDSQLSLVSRYPILRSESQGSIQSKIEPRYDPNKRSISQLSLRSHYNPLYDHIVPQNHLKQNLIGRSQSRSGLIDHDKSSLKRSQSQTSIKSRFEPLRRSQSVYSIPPMPLERRNSISSIIANEGSLHDLRNRNYSSNGRSSVTNYHRGEGSYPLRHSCSVESLYLTKQERKKIMDASSISYRNNSSRSTSPASLKAIGKDKQYLPFNWREDEMAPPVAM